MIATKFRVPSVSIQYILAKGQEAHSILFIARYIINKEGHNRFRTIISTKFDKSAVKRNRLRRRIYEAVRNNMGKLNFDIILIPRKHLKTATFAEIEKDIRTILDKF